MAAVISIQRESVFPALADCMAAGFTTLENNLATAAGMTAIALLRRERPVLCIGAGVRLLVGGSFRR